VHVGHEFNEANDPFALALDSVDHRAPTATSSTLSASAIARTR
jgi:hypothetical protein